MKEQLAKSSRINDNAEKKHSKQISEGKSGICGLPSFLNGHPIQRKASCACGGGCPNCQAKSSNLPVSQPHDAAEIEADRIAEKILQPSADHSRMTIKKVNVKGRKMQKQPHKSESRLNRKVKSFDAAQTNSTVNPATEVLAASDGQSLSTKTREFFEPRLGYDLENVRVHHGTKADASAKSVNALAFTLGNNIVFAEHQFEPETEAGKKLLAHELVHTIQQSEGKINRQIQRTGAGNCARLADTVDEQRDELSFAGRTAHQQVQGFFATQLKSEVSIPRATKAQRATACPPPATPRGQADLWKYDEGLSPVKIGEIKSVHGANYAVPDADHYRLRLRELASRVANSGTPCPGPADTSDTNFDANYLGGSLGSGRTLNYNALDEVVPDTMTRLGPFWGDPLKKELRCERRTGGAVLYWCVNRGLTEEEEAAERVRLRIPVGEDGRRTVPQPGTVAPVIVDIHPLFREVARQLPGQISRQRIITIAVPEVLFREVVGADHMRRQIERMRIPYERSPIHQFRMLTWGTLAVVLGVGTLAAITAVAIAAVPVAAGATVGGGAIAGGGAAGGTLAPVIPLFTAASSQEIAKAAAVLIVAGTLAASSEAEAQTAVNRALSVREVVASIDVTDDPFALSGGMRVGSNVLINNLPYKVVAQVVSSE